MKKLLTLLGITSLSLSGVAALTSYVVMSNQNSWPQYNPSTFENKNIHDHQKEAPLVEEDFENLQDVVRVRNLGEFDSFPNLVSIIDRAGVLNPDLDTSQVLVENITLNQATMKVIDGSTVYNPGSVTVTYQVNHRLELSDVIQRPFIFNFGVYPDEFMVLEYTKLANPDLELSEVSVSQVGWESALLTVNANSTIYRQGSVMVFYSISLPPIDIYIPNDLLGEYETTPTEAQIFDRLVEWITDAEVSQYVRSDIRIIEIDEENHLVWVQATPESKIFNQLKIRLRYRLIGEIVDEHIDLSEVVWQRDLGHFASDLNERTALSAIARFNPGIDLTQVVVSSIRNRRVYLDVIDGSTLYNYPDQAVFSYTVESPIPLTSVVFWDELGFVDHVPTDEEILIRVKDNNSRLDLREVHISRIIPGNRWRAQMTVNDRSRVYLPGSMFVSFDVGRKDVTADLQITNLGNFLNAPNARQIQERLAELNPNLWIDEIIITTNIGANSVAVRVRDGSYIYDMGAVVLTFSVGQRAFLADAITVNTLGTFDFRPTDEDILLVLGLMNPNLDLSQVEVANRLVNNELVYVFIRVVERSAVYNPGTAIVSFNQLA